MPHPKTQNPYMFQLQKDGKTIYLLGTNHEIPLEVLPEPCLEIIENCEHLFKEVFNVFPQPGCKHSDNSYQFTKEQMQYAHLLRTKDDENWYAKLSRTEIAALQTAWKKIKQYYPNDVRPQDITITELEYRLGLHNQERGMDQHIERNHFEGKHKGKQAYMLDTGTLLAHREIRESETDICSIKALLNTVAFDPENYKEFYSGDLNEHFDTSQSNCKERNQKWMRKIHSKIRTEKGQILIVVGHYHLGTEDGLLAEFVHHGYNIKRMNAHGHFENCPYSDLTEMQKIHAKGKFIQKSMQEIESDISNLQNALLSTTVNYLPIFEPVLDKLHALQDDFHQLDENLFENMLTFKELVEEQKIHTQYCIEQGEMVKRINSIIDFYTDPLHVKLWDDTVEKNLEKLNNMKEKINQDSPLSKDELNLVEQEKQFIDSYQPQKRRRMGR